MKREAVRRPAIPDEETDTAHTASARKRGYCARRWMHPKIPVAISRRPYPIPSRTRKSSSSEPMVLHDFSCGRVGRCRVKYPKRGLEQCFETPFSFCRFASGDHMRCSDGSVGEGGGSDRK